MTNAPAGWYPDVTRPGTQRYWDGSAWTEHSQPLVQAASPTPVKRSHRGWWIAGAVIAALLIVPILIGIVVASVPPEAFQASAPQAPVADQAEEPEPVEQDLGDPVMAWIMCQEEMSSLLKAPATAGYPLSNEFQIRQTENKYDMEAWVDAENGFGANIRTYFGCRAVYVGNEQWKILVTPHDS
ncbi:MAG: DUF2510 domain-containing protein [Actinomycetota bacterium]|nr:DUF2510 domain-containing protein [Actinomycetota bacterium]